jgi:hypothetical protein
VESKAVRQNHERRSDPHYFFNVEISLQPQFLS